MKLLVCAALLALGLVVPASAQTLEQMAGQMIVVGFKGDDASDASVKAIAAEIASGDLGGVMYLKPNVKSLKAVQAMNAAFRAASPDLPPFLTLDQEGGAVERLTSVGTSKPGSSCVCDGTPGVRHLTRARTRLTCAYTQLFAHVRARV